jgi:hypothetical protein
LLFLRVLACSLTAATRALKSLLPVCCSGRCAYHRPHSTRRLHWVGCSRIVVSCTQWPTVLPQRCVHADVQISDCRFGEPFCPHQWRRPDRDHRQLLRFHLNHSHPRCHRWRTAVHWRGVHNDPNHVHGAWRPRHQPGRFRHHHGPRRLHFWLCQRVQLPRCLLCNALLLALVLLLMLSCSCSPCRCQRFGLPGCAEAILDHQLPHHCWRSAHHDHWHQLRFACDWCHGNARCTCQLFDCL